MTLPTAWAASLWNSAPVAADLADLGERLNDADLVVRGHDRDQHGVVVEGRGDGFGVDQAVRTDRQNGDAEALRLQVAAAFQHAFMLGRDGHDMILATRPMEPRRALDGQVVGLGRARGKDDLAWGRADRRGDLGAGAFDRVLGVPAKRMALRVGISEMTAEIGFHRRHDAGVGRGRGLVIQVDDVLAPVSAHGHIPHFKPPTARCRPA